jgi:gentisate 1,2-dioxygenase
MTVAPSPTTARITRRATAVESWESAARFHEYSAAVTPQLPSQPIAAFPATLHEHGETRCIPFDLSSELGCAYPATTPALLAGFLRLRAGETLPTRASATSQLFYVMRGSGRTHASFGTIAWQAGDLFTMPLSAELDHTAAATGDAALFWVNDEPLLSYLGAQPGIPRFAPTLYPRDLLRAAVERIRREPGAEGRNRLGTLLGNSAFPDTMTVTHTLWSLFNCLPAHRHQAPHRHQSVAIDCCIEAGPGTYTLIGRELDAQGLIRDPVRAPWHPGSVFITPPGWWHAHHNESGQDALVLPIQDAALHTYLRTLDFQMRPA